MLAVRDIMKTDVVTVEAEDSARELARVLAEARISGVPVMNGARVVGVVSATDLVNLAASDGEIALSSLHVQPADRLGAINQDELQVEDDPEEADPWGFFLPEDAPLQSAGLLGGLPEDAFDSVRVGDIMTPVSFSVRPEMPVPELCDFLVRGRIHRAVVLDDGALVGIVTTQDVLRSVADGAFQG